MAFCNQCGNQVNNGENVCSRCGTPVSGGSVSLGKDPQPNVANQQTQPNQPDFNQVSNNVAQAGNNFVNTVTSVVNSTADTTSQYDQADIQNSTLMGVLSYLSFLVFIPILGAKNSPYSRFHANQGLVLFLIEFAWGIVSSIIQFILPLGIISLVCNLVSLVLVAVAILGIVNVVNGKAKELPIIGGIRILK